MHKHPSNRLPADASAKESATPKHRNTVDTENDMSDPIFLPEPTLAEEAEEAEDAEESGESEPIDTEVRETQPDDQARVSRKLKLLALINTRLEEAKSAKSKSAKPKSLPNTRAESGPR